MPVITAQTGPLLSAPYAQASGANPVQGQPEGQGAAPGDWQAALAQLDALLQSVLPGTAQPQAAASDQPLANATQGTDTAALEEPAVAPLLDAPTQTQPDLHTALRRLTTQEHSEEPAGDTQAALPDDAAPAVVQAPLDVNTALLRQLNAPLPARIANVVVEARAEMSIDGDVPRGDRGSRVGDQLPAFSRSTTGAQIGAELAARIDSSTPGAVRIDGLVTERPLALTTPAPAQVTHEWAPLKLGDKSAQWGQQLLDTLRERVEMQVNQQVKQAHIRLDPPDMGRLELTVRLDGDHLSVQINANHAQLRDALLQAGERLRVALMPQHAGGVSVDVGQGAPDDRSGQSRGEQGILAGRRSSAELDADLNELAPAGWLNTLV